MAKVTFNKLALPKDCVNAVKTVEINGQVIEVRQYLPAQEKLELITDVIQQAHDPEQNYNNPLKTEIYFTIGIIEKYTNITFTEAQKKDITKLYDLLVASGAWRKINEAISATECVSLNKALRESIESIYEYQNSVLGILDTMKTDYSNLDLEIGDLQNKISDPNSLSLVKDVLSKLG